MGRAALSRLEGLRFGTSLLESSFLDDITSKRPLTRPNKSGHPLPLGEGGKCSEPGEGSVDLSACIGGWFARVLTYLSWKRQKIADDCSPQASLGVREFAPAFVFLVTATIRTPPTRLSLRQHNL